jgi:large subunit ribosomal protein L15
MQQHDLRPPKGASGHGTYSTRGLKGQKARSGGGVRPHFEGGQLPFVRRMAYKRGFRNPFRVEYEAVNVGDLARFAAGDEVTVATLRDARLVRRGKPVKVLGTGDLSVALTVEADSFSSSARSKIEAAGGSVRWIGGEPVKEEPAEEAKAKKPRARKSAESAESDADAEKPEAKAKKQDPAEQGSGASSETQGEDSDGAGS